MPTTLVAGAMLAAILLAAAIVLLAVALAVDAARRARRSRRAQNATPPPTLPRVFAVANGTVTCNFCGRTDKATDHLDAAPFIDAHRTAHADQWDAWVNEPWPNDAIAPTAPTTPSASDQHAR